MPRQPLPSRGPKFGRSVGATCVYQRFESARTYKPFLLYKGGTLCIPSVDVAQLTVGPIYGAEPEWRYISRRINRLGEKKRNARRVFVGGRYENPFAAVGRSDDTSVAASTAWGKKAECPACV